MACEGSPAIPNALSNRWSKLAAPLVLAGIGLAIQALAGPNHAAAQQQPRTSAFAPRPRNPAQVAAAPGKQAGPAAPAVAAVVNGEKISVEDLGRECLRHYGTEVLESLTNKFLIAEHCQQTNLVVTKQEVDERVEQMARRFGLPKDQWLKMLETERGIKPEQYASDIIWPTLALEKLAAPRLTVDEQELKESYETYYGPTVRVRLIVLDDAETARKVLQLARANPDDFGNLAKDYSVDVNSASAKGMIPPIRLHVGDKEIERIAFSMSEGQISDVIPVANQQVILKCEAQLPARQIAMADVQTQLADEIRDRKLRGVADELFRELQQQAQVENVLNDPAKQAQMPGVAAIVNGRQIMLQQLAGECVTRHGVEVLEGSIHHKILEQACREKRIEVTQADIEAEVARAAVAMGVADAQGQPDLPKWYKMMTEEQGLTAELYHHDVVWPTAALKKLVGETVQVTDEDLKKGYEANYGPRVRCRAIVLNNSRKAQEVWEKARQNPTEDFFGDLAEQYSIEPSSRVLRGEVPPIQKHGGQPKLEEEAFNLRPGELSGVIQISREHFVILRCEGHTEPTQVDFNQVRELIAADIHEKKLRLAMAKEFERLQAQANIQNFLSRTPVHAEEYSPPLGPGKPQPQPAATTRRPAGPVAPPRR
ncbi:MAG: peptidyl-prolyl cis-trans isomerase [Planctomycetes bacterium]|nr:peptidyl-prolyl cis-trans isomerase [Planctomycetota bacterium]